MRSAPSRRVSRDALALAGGTIATGALAYAFVALVTRTVGAEAAAPIAVLWTYWSASAAILVFPLQHWIVRRVKAEGSEDGVRASLPRVATFVVVAAVAASLGSWGLRGVLFSRQDLVFPLAVGAVTVGSGFVGTVRGWLASRGRFVATAGAIVGENGVRVAAAVLVTLVHPSVSLYAAALVSGPLIGLLWPGAVRGTLTGPSGGGTGFGFLGGIAGSSLCAQLVLTSGPVVLALVGGAPARVTSLFAALALYRAPYLVALGMVTQLTGYLTQLVVAGRERLLNRLRWLLVSGSVTAAVLGGVLAHFVGAEIVALVFGETVSLPGAIHAWLAVGTVLALGNLVMTVQLVARQVATRALTAWGLGLVVASGVLFVVAVPLEAVVGAFVAAEFFALAGLVVFDVRMGGDTVTPGRAGGST